MWQVVLWDDRTNRPVTGDDEACRALVATLGDFGEWQPDDRDRGVWLVELPDDALAALALGGRLDREGDGFRLVVELP